MLPIPVRCAVFMALVLGCPRAQEEVVVTWKDRDLPVKQLAGDAPRAIPLITEWTEFARKHGYRLVLSDNRRVLLVLSGTYHRLKNGKEFHDVARSLELVDDTCAVVDSFAAPPGDSTPPVPIVCVKSKDYPALLDYVTARHEKVKQWAGAAARKVAGFVLSDPLLAAWIEDPQGVTEWLPYNELVHRTAQLMIRREYPHLPDWLLLGLAWHTEDEVCRSVYCFPHRAGFVFATEHTDWGLWLANRFKARRRKKNKLPPCLQMTEFADWFPRKDGGFSTGKAYISFGVARYLVRQRAKSLPELEKKLNDAVEKGSKVKLSDTKWTTNPDYQLPVDEQLALLEKVDSGFLKHVTRYFQSKKANHHPSRRRRRR